MVLHLLCLGSNEKNNVLTMVVLRVQRKALVLQWFCLGSEDKVWFHKVLLKVQRKNNSFTMVLLRVKRESTGVTVVLLRINRKTRVL